MKAKTYEDWHAAGFQVMRGEKATGRCPRTGKPTFTRDQVETSDRFDRVDDPNRKPYDG